MDCVAVTGYRFGRRLFLCHAKINPSQKHYLSVLGAEICSLFGKPHETNLLLDQDLKKVIAGVGSNMAVSAQEDISKPRSNFPYNVETPSLLYSVRICRRYGDKSVEYGRGLL